MSSMSRYELAGRLCRQVAIERLNRIGERMLPDDLARNPLDDQPAEEREDWLIMADVVSVILNEYDNASRLRSLANDWDRYGYLLQRDPAHRDSMRRAVVVEIRVLVDQMWKECGGE